VTAYRHIEKSTREAQADADRTGEAHCVVELGHPVQYLVRTQLKAKRLCAKHGDALIRVTVYPAGLDMGGAA
jgi:hypothetical protein